MPNGDLQISFHKAEVADTVNVLHGHPIVYEANPVILTRYVVCVPKYILLVLAVCTFLGIPAISDLSISITTHSFLVKRSELAVTHSNAPDFVPSVYNAGITFYTCLIRYLSRASGH